MRGNSNFFQAPERQLRNCLAVTGQHGLEWLNFGKCRLRLDHRRHPVEAINKLAVGRMLNLKSAVLIESCNAFLGWHQLWARRVSGSAHEVEDRLLRRSFIRGASGSAGNGPCGGSPVTAPAQQ